MSPDEYKIPSEFLGPQPLVNNYRMDAERDLIAFDCYTNETVFPTVDKIVNHVASMSVQVASLYVQDKTAKAVASSNSVANSAEGSRLEPRNGKSSRFMRALNELIKAKG